MLESAFSMGYSRPRQSGLDGQKRSETSSRLPLNQSGPGSWPGWSSKYLSHVPVAQLAEALPREGIQWVFKSLQAHQRMIPKSCRIFG